MVDMQHIFFNEEWNPNEKQETTNNLRNSTITNTTNNPTDKQERTDVQSHIFFG